VHLSVLVCEDGRCMTFNGCFGIIAVLSLRVLLLAFSV
jgi:hypothetical protein